MSEDLIRRSDAILAIAGLDPTQSLSEKCMAAFWAKKALSSVPTVEPKRGEWIDLNDKWGFEGTFKCSACGELWSLIDGTPQDNGMNFCPNCGARMKGADDETD